MLSRFSLDMVMGPFEDIGMKSNDPVYLTFCCGLNPDEWLYILAADDLRKRMDKFPWLKTNRKELT
jgi:hypothetical protein